MRNVIICLFIAFASCNSSSDKNTTNLNMATSVKEDVEKAIKYNYEFISTKNLADDATFNQFKTLYTDSFVLGPSEGKALSNKETILNEWRELFLENKGVFNLTIDRIEASGDLAYVLYHYDEKLTNIQSGEVFFEVVQSAIAVLRKDTSGNWKFEALRWN